MSAEKRFGNHDTDLLAGYLRGIREDWFSKESDVSAQLTAAADRLQALHRTEPSSARVSSEGTSERERVKALREAFEAGAWAAHSANRGCWKSKKDNALYDWQRDASSPFLNISRLEDAVAEKYPLPPIVRPLRVTLSDKSVWSYEPSIEPDEDYSPMVRHNAPLGRFVLSAVAHHFDEPRDMRLLIRILSGETETVDDDGSLLPSLDGSE